MSILIGVQQADFIPATELERLEALGGGAVASFTGIVRADAVDTVALELETYPAMAEQALRAIAQTATERWPLLGVTMIHRYGRLPVGARIVLVGTASRHRGAAMEACAFLIDWAKTAAPFWKKEWQGDGAAHWVEPRVADDAAAAAWASRAPK